MGSSASACLAYGFDLGSADDFKAAERGEYGGPDLPWYDNKAEWDLVGQMFNHLYAQLPDPPQAKWDWQRKDAAVTHFGVDVEYCGSREFPGWALVAPASVRSVKWAETMMLDLGEMATGPALNGHRWDRRLTTALAALGITPTQDRPRWLVFPFYGLTHPTHT